MIVIIIKLVKLPTYPEKLRLKQLARTELRKTMSCRFASKGSLAMLSEHRAVKARVLES